MCHPRLKRYKELNTAFYSDILGKLNLKKVKIWFCCHTHDIKIVIKPVGYPKEYKVTKISLDTYDI